MLRRDVIAADAERLVSEWQEACRIPSISSDREAIEEMSAWVMRRVSRRFDRVVVDRTSDGVPVVLAELAGTTPYRLIIYTHYDVVPVGRADAWRRPPFAAAIENDAVFARGACDDKADITARLQAIDYWREAHPGRPPITLLWICEGAEEIGSPGLREVLDRNASWLSASDCLWESFVRRSDGRPEIAFGCRGLVTAELEVQLLEQDQHAAFSPVLRSAAWQLTHALASLADQHGNVCIDGFYDDVARPGEAAVAAARELVPPGEGLGPGGTSAAVAGSTQDRAWRLSFTPNVNISALSAGSPESKSGVVPAVAHARIDLHLVPDQDPEDIEQRLRTHLLEHGFGDVRVSTKALVWPAPGALATPLAEAAVAAAAEVYGEPVVYPQLPGAGPARIVFDALGATTVSPAGTTRLTSGLHGLNEHGAIEDYLDHVRFSLRLLEKLSVRALAGG